MAIYDYECSTHGYIGCGNAPVPACPICGEPTRKFSDEEPEYDDDNDEPGRPGWRGLV